MTSRTTNERAPRLTLAARELTPSEREAPAEVAKLALHHLLARACSAPNSHVAIAPGTESLALMLRAIAACTGKSVVEVEDAYLEASRG